MPGVFVHVHLTYGHPGVAQPSCGELSKVGTDGLIVMPGRACRFMIASGEKAVACDAGKLWELLLSFGVPLSVRSDTWREFGDCHPSWKGISGSGADDPIICCRSSAFLGQQRGMRRSVSLLA